jgi:hypothetical protein
MDRLGPTNKHGSKVPFYGHAHFHFTLAFVVTMAGFWPSFFSRPGKTDASHMVHGVSATLWMIVPIVQAWLISHREFEWHRRVGRLVFLLAPIMVVSGLRMVQIMLLKDQGISRTLRIKFTFLDLSCTVPFHSCAFGRPETCWLSGRVIRTVPRDLLDHIVEIGIASAKASREPIPTAFGYFLPIRDHVELTGPARGSHGFNVETPFDEGHETRSLGLVVLSRRAVKDLDLHSVLRFIVRAT